MIKLIKRTKTRLVFKKKGLDKISALVTLFFLLLVLPLIIFAFFSDLNFMDIVAGILWILIVGAFLLLMSAVFPESWDEIYSFDKTNNLFTIAFKDPSKSNFFRQFWPVTAPKTISCELSAIEAVEVIRSGSDGDFYEVNLVFLPAENSIKIPTKLVNSSDGKTEKKVAESISSFLGLPKPQVIDQTPED